MRSWTRRSRSDRAVRRGRAAAPRPPARRSRPCRRRPSPCPPGPGARRRAWCGPPSSRRARSPRTLAAGTRTPSRKTSLKWAVARHLAQRPHRDARRVHVDDEHGDALALGARRIAAGQAGGVVAVLGARGPDLLPVEHELVAVEPGPGLHAGEVRARTGLAEQLAPDVLAAQQRRDQRLLLLLAGVHEQRRAAHAEPDLEGAGRDLERLGLAVEDALEPAAAARDRRTRRAT